MSFWRQNGLLVATLICVGLGFGIGFYLRKFSLSEDALTWIGMPGELFFRGLNMLVLPLILPSIFIAISGMNPKDSTKTIGIVFGYGIAINIAMNFVGYGFSVLVRPGTRSSAMGSLDNFSGTKLTPSDLMADFFRNLIPDNLVEAFFSSTLTDYRTSAGGKVERFQRAAPGSNIIGLVIVTIVLGVVGSTIPGEVAQLFQVVGAFQRIINKVFKKLFLFMPLGIMSIIAKVIYEAGDVTTIFSSVGFFCIAVTVTLSVQMLIIIPLAIFILTRENPLRLMGKVFTGFVVSVSTASSLSGVPKLSEAISREFRVDSNQASSAVALSVPICSSGSTAYITCALLFVGNLQQQPFSTEQIVISIFLNALAVIALPTIPNSSIVLVIILLNSLGVSTHYAGLLLTIDWLLDRLRTGVNYYNMCVCSVIACKFSEKADNSC